MMDLAQFGNKGKGESVWLGFFLYNVLDKFNNICLKTEDKTEYVEKYERIKKELRQRLNTNGWDGKWFKRAFMDDGTPLGSDSCIECKIDCIAQSWSVISNAGDKDKCKIAMQSLEKYLLDKEAGIIKLLTPAFEKSELEPGYIKAYLPFVRENGGQYTHAAIWAVIGTAMMNENEKAVCEYKMINPIEHANTKEKAELYKVEPYAIAADVYGGANLLGRGGWTWYTGSSSWYYKAGIEYILGLKINNGVLSISPCIPASWDEYNIRYEYKTSVYNIRVKNISKAKPNIVRSFKLGGEEIESKSIKLIDNGRIYEIEVEL